MPMLDAWKIFEYISHGNHVYWLFPRFVREGLFPRGPSLHQLHERQISSQILSRCLWLILIAIHFDRPKQMRERELGELPLAVFLDINLSHHKRIGDFVLTDCCLQINVL